MCHWRSHQQLKQLHLQHNHSFAMACVRLNRPGIKLNDSNCASLHVTCCIIHTVLSVRQSNLTLVFSVMPMINPREEEERGSTSALRRCAVY